MLFVVRAVLMRPFLSQTVAVYTAARTRDDLLFLKELIEARKLTPVIDRSYSLSEVPDAIRYLEAGHAQGKVVITV
jgi:NADPH:quinone reductase-like Zn-dependent oxidoreductase